MSLCHAPFHQLDLLAPEDAGENKSYLSEQIITYIGNKRTLLPFIDQAVCHVQNRLGKKKLRLLDLFSGTGVVARFLKQYAESLITNDMEAYSRVTNQCYLANVDASRCRALTEFVKDVRSQIDKEWGTGFITELYSPKDEANITKNDRCFYTQRNATFLDTAVRIIHRLEEPERTWLLAPLLAEASVHANTSGVFKGFYKNDRGVGQFGGTSRDALFRILGDVSLKVPVFSKFRCSFEVYQQDANTVIHKLPEVDLAYLDPPYNQHPYGSNYFMLNLLVDYRRPTQISKVSGIPTEWNRSRFNQRAEAETALFDIVRNINAKFVLISYNSEGFVTHDRFMETLNACGTVTVMETTYNTFRGSRNLRGRSLHVKEFLYLLEKNGGLHGK